MDSDFDPYKRTSVSRPHLPKSSDFWTPAVNNVQESTRGDDFAREEYEIPQRRNIVEGKLVEDSLPEISLEQHANNIACLLERDEVLMEDSPESEQLRKQTLKNMPQCLTVKRHIKSKLLKTVSQKSKKKPLGFFKRKKYQFSIKFAQLQASLNNLIYTFELWYSSLKTVEGHFGSGVATYFKFVRWLFLMNVFVMIFTLAFIVAPQIIYDLTGARDQNNVTSSSSETAFHVEDIFTGEGYFTDTLLYYGHYTNETLKLIENAAPYSMPFAYFFTVVVLFFCCFVILSYSMASSYRRNFIETEGGLKNVFAHKVFCGWDFGIATEEAADLKSSSLFLEMRELLSDMVAKSMKKTCLVVFWSKTIQVIVNLLIIVGLSAIGYLLWVYLERESSHQSGIVTSVIISAIVALVPLIFGAIVKYEDYKSPRVTLYITLARIFLLGACVLGVLLVFWIQHADEHACWCTSFGIEMYRLVLYDFIFNVLLKTVTGTFEYLFVVKVCRWSTGVEFDIARSTLSIIYNQTLFWMGFFYAPLIVVMVVVKLFLTWYIQKTFLLRLCVPSSRSWRAAQTQTVFLILAFLSLLMVLAVHGYMIVEVQAPECGPFGSYAYAYEIVIGGLLRLEQDSVFWKVLIYFTRPGVIALILVAICVRVYYLRAKALAQREMVDILREMLTWEAKDKEFLLEHISKVTEGQWQYSLHRKEGGASFVPAQTLRPSSSTKKYL